MASVDEIVLALRCTASAESVCRKWECPYYSRMSKQQQREYCRKVRLNPDKVTDEFWDDCDADQICLDAADLIEGLTRTIVTQPADLSFDDIAALENALSKGPVLINLGGADSPQVG